MRNTQARVQGVLDRLAHQVAADHDEAGRDAFMATSFSELNLTEVEQAESEEAPHWLGAIVGGFLESVTFVADYVQLHWTAGTMNAYRMPRLESVAGGTFEPTDPRQPHSPQLRES